jgi:hypothetical protein
MSVGHPKIVRNTVIEEITASRIREYEAKTGSTVVFPVPIEKIIEQVLGLTFDWDEIEEEPGEQILGGLVAKHKKILLNEKHMALFQEKPGLERSTIGHEAGHWDVDIDRSNLLHPNLPGMDTAPHIVKRHSKKNDLVVDVLTRAMTDDRYRQLYKKITQGEDAPDVRSAVDRYQSALLMPVWLLKEAQGQYDFTHWPSLYDLAKLAQVNISNLTTRLKRLDMLFIPKDSKKLYRNKAEFSGQSSMF